ncbi:MAG: MotA/TolQ/ExbB proton channel family protein [Methanobrevibacter sp.]|uniref:MotA/TolQ/ExbB proton channel family protein n=1 Tax=Methanobrevibacter sp. TaxID=66852 RepID=UPI0025CDE75C|nr:MotA/TolQ/ExbB proton channel family protein [Methanobrevibacter sp.]MBQ6100579.1 MotA/TolQ/ExbB proton channel family protein [Methanobrevibacter sp.]MBQ6100610.1 MotA/TolQ/ExbB proton channel family protein [Methanobrevibacter sp.]
MVGIPGSEFLTAALNVVSQSLQIPVIIFLLAFAIFAVFAFGGLISDYSTRKKLTRQYKEELIFSLVNAGSIEELKNIVNDSGIYDNQKEVLLKIIDAHSLSSDSREAWALNLIEEEEVIMAKSLERVDIVTRIGPTLGLMGTLIPMGPGLAALGSGDVTTLANAIIVAFDTTVVGIGSGAIAYVISKIRRRWYEEYSSNLQLFVNAVLENLGK